jgi:2-dehydropantoate 2-reductase
MRIAIIGTGGVGGYFGARLAAAGADVVFFARGNHLQALKTHGLQLESINGNLHLPTVNATDDPSNAGPVDAVFFTVKLYDTDTAVKLLPPLIGNDTVVIPFQNGVESIDRLADAVDRAHVAGGTVYISSIVTEPGVIKHTALGRMIFGELSGERTPRMERLLEQCRQAEINVDLSDHIEVDIWSKFVHLSVFSGMTTVTRAPVGVLRDDPDLFAMWQAAVVESIAVARAKGIGLPRSAFEDVIRNVNNFPAQARSSMLEDLERGRRLELPWLSGGIARMGRELDIDTPIHRFIATVLKPYVNGRAAASVATTSLRRAEFKPATYSEP